MNQIWRDHVSVVLVRTRNPLNIGAAARIMSNLGFLDLRLVQPWEPSFCEARSAVGAAEVLRNAKAFGSIAEATADCRLVVGTTAVRDRELHQPLEDLTGGARKVGRAVRAGRAAVLFGSEKTGLSTQELSHCDLLLRIPTREEHVSLNLAQAVAITLYELGRKETRGTVAQPTRAKSEDLERLTDLMGNVLNASEYVKKDSAAATKLKVRRLVRRLKLTEDDAQLLQGMLRKIEWKLKHG